MCLGENLAPFATRYLNAQLTALYENAKLCVSEHPEARDELNQQFSALAQYAIGIAGQPTTALQAIFGKPELQFICNHNVVLKLEIVSFRGPQEFNNIFVNFRIPVRWHTSELTNPPDFGNLVRFEVFDFENAELLSIWRCGCESDVAVEVADRRILAEFLGQYLRTLCKARINALFALPQSYLEGGDALVLDHAYAEGSSRLRVPSLAGITTIQINEYLFSEWLECSMRRALRPLDTYDDWAAVCLSDYVFSDHPSESVHFEFSAPSIEILCLEEVIITFNAKKIRFYEAGEVVAEYENWTLAFVMYTDWEKTSDDGCITIWLDFSRGCRPHTALSKTPECCEDTYELLTVYRQRVFEIMECFYMETLVSAKFDVLYSTVPDQPLCPAGPEFPLGIWGDTKLPERAKDDIRTTNLGDFDQVVAVSQESINAYIATLYEKPPTILKKWQYGHWFEATFARPQIRLLSDKRALFWVNIKQCSFVPTDGFNVATLENEDEYDDYDTRELNPENRHKANDTYLAFEVGIQWDSEGQFRCGPGEKTGAYPAIVEHGEKGDRELRRIVLDFDGARYLHKYSSLCIDSDLCHRTHILQSLVVYLKKAYFPAIHQECLDVIATIPTWIDEAKAPPYGMFHADFHIHCDRTITVDNWYSSVADYPASQPILVVWGVTTPGKSLPQELPPPSSWIPRFDTALSGFSHGTVAIAKHVFIQRAVLEPLARINALTTLVPEWTCLLPGISSLKLRTWSNVEGCPGVERTVPTNWCPQPSDEPGHLKYLWNYEVDLPYRYKGSFDEFEYEERATCRTENWLSVPTTVSKGSPQVQISGTITLTTSYTKTLKETKEVVSSTSARATVKWSLSFGIETVGSTISIKLSELPQPVFTLEECPVCADVAHVFSTYTLKDPEALLRNAFPSAIHLSDVLEDAPQPGAAAGGLWSYFYPLGGAYRLGTLAFNDNGDLLLELCRSGQPPLATKQSVTFVRSATTTVATALLTVKREVGITRRSRSRSFGIGTP
ncbi:hypothetical protein C8Q78DRAFT_1082416 [Trametes maxima]|nr:hypothetical protein C8Q78DRAFT_1082416 [Trametes maxima]